MKRIPIFVTLLVLVAVATMIGLGVWQLQRAQWKKQLLTTYAAAANRPAISWPNVPEKKDAPYFRKSSVTCLAVTGWRAVSGENVKGEAGWAHIASCRTAGAEGPGAQVVAGWSGKPADPVWRGGTVTGMIAPDNQSIIRLVADPPVAGLVQAKPPSVADIPNNHTAYAWQWFFFAGAATVIYLLALRQRIKGTR